jgi:hypothetical protein
MAGPGSLVDLRELLEPIKAHLTGLAVVYHGATTDEETQYLEANKGEGLIIYLPYTGRHDLSRNVALHCGKIQDGDWVLQCDTLERIQPRVLTELIPNLVQIRDGTNAYFYYGKPLFYLYHESLRFIGTPHEGLRRDDGYLRAKELSGVFPDSQQEIRVNVRPIKRDKWHFIKHYARYSLLPWGSNHYLLPLSGKPNAAELFEKREKARMVFIDLLRQLNIKRDVDSVIAYMKAVKMDLRFIKHVENDKVWNDVYRFYIKGMDDFVDDHDWSNVIKVDSPSQAS